MFQKYYNKKIFFNFFTITQYVQLNYKMLVVLFCKSYKKKHNLNIFIISGNITICKSSEGHVYLTKVLALERLPRYVHIIVIIL